MKSSGIGDTAVFGPEPEFFVFDDVRFDVQMQGSFFKIAFERSRRGTRAPKFEGGNMGHRPGVKGGYFPVPPVDSHQRPARRDVSVCDRDGPRSWKSITTKWRPARTSSAPSSTPW